MAGAGVLTVVHVVSTRQRRGAEVFASDLVRALDGRARQRVVVLRTVGPSGVAFEAPALDLGAPPGARGSLLGARRLRAAVGGDRGTVVCAHGGEALRVAVLSGARRIVYRRIGSAPPTITHGARRQWHRFLMRRASLTLAVADFVRDETIAVFGLAPERVLTVPNAVDPGRAVTACSRAECRDLLGVPAGAPVIASVGSLSWEKGPLRALRITGPLLSGDPSVVHLFVGDGALEGELRAAAAAERLAGVRIMPSRPDIGVVLAAADVLLSASRSGAMEGMPAVLIEAGLAGLPVVADDIAGVGEVVIDGETGVLVPAGDDGASTRAVGLLLGNAAERARLGEAACRRCRRLFTIDAVAGQYLDAFARVRGPG